MDPEFLTWEEAGKMGTQEKVLDNASLVLARHWRIFWRAELFLVCWAAASNDIQTQGGWGQEGTIHLGQSMF
jgi:hypothetical protein